MDSTCFKDCVVLPNGFGQFVNTSHPKSKKKSIRAENAQYYCGEDYKMIVKAIRDIKKGEEILCDYH